MKGLVNKEDIILIIICKKEDINKINTENFDNNYHKIYYNYNHNLEYILMFDKSKYYSIYDYNNQDNINDSFIILNPYYEEKEYIKNPEISVIVCLYNNPTKDFKNCIDGLLSQSFTNFEVIIVNDGSTKYYKQNYKLVNDLNDNRFIWINKEHSGKSQTLNLGLSKVRGKYIAINDADDLSLSDRFEYQYNFLQENLNYDYISNNMIRMNDLQIFPNNCKESGEVTSDTIHYCTNHPCSMFRKEILDKLPFWFSQFYDSYEDCVFHYICFYYGVKMYYDNEILMHYNYNPNVQVHYENIHGFKHDVHYKITYNTYNIKREWSSFGIYLILFDHNLWTDAEIEKTLLNFRVTSNNINIYILYNDNFNINKLKSICNKYGILDYKKFDNQYSIFKEDYYDQNLKYIGIISKPCRFYIQNWDIQIKQKLNINEYSIIQPLLFDIQKIDDNNYKNESNKLEKEYTYGERLTPLCYEFTEQNDINFINTTNEYVKEYEIPLLSNDNIFFLTNDVWKGLLSKLSNFDIIYYELSNIFISYILYQFYNNITKITFDIEIGTIDYKFNIKNYYNNYKLFVYSYLNETIYLHDQLFKDIENKHKFKLNDIECTSKINNFIKKQNKQSWDL